MASLRLWYGVHRSSSQSHVFAGTHSLGPVLQWFKNATTDGYDRVCSVTCADSGSHYRDEKGQLYASDGAVLLGKTVKGRLIKLCVDLVCQARAHHTALWPFVVLLLP